MQCTCHRILPCSSHASSLSVPAWTQQCQQRAFQVSGLQHSLSGFSLIAARPHPCPTRIFPLLLSRVPFPALSLDLPRSLMWGEIWHPVFIPLTPTHHSQTADGCGSASPQQSPLPSSRTEGGRYPCCIPKFPCTPILSLHAEVLVMPLLLPLLLGLAGFCVLADVSWPAL